MMEQSQQRYSMVSKIDDDGKLLKKPLADTTDEGRNNDNAVQTKQVVFQSDAAYQFATYLLIAFAPIVVIINIISVYNDPNSTDEEKKKAVRSLIATFVALTIVFSLVLPRRFEVLSDASINVVTWFKIKWNFSNITGAYDHQTIWSEWSRPKFKFAVHLTKRVIVRRKNGLYWDVLVSPQDPEGFVDAIWKVIGEYPEEEQTDKQLS